MTCIAVHVHDGVAHLAADSLASAGSGPTVALSKLIEFDRGVVMGVAGRAAATNLLRRHLDVAQLGDGDPNDWAQGIAEDITALLIDHGVVADEDEHGRGFEGAVILAHRGRVWEITTHLAAPIVRDFHAIGTGDAAAMGAMWAVDRTSGPVAVIGVAAAVELLVDVGGVVHTAST